jgi:hypothetical protein
MFIPTGKEVTINKPTTIAQDDLRGYKLPTRIKNLVDGDVDLFTIRRTINDTDARAMMMSKAAFDLVSGAGPTFHVIERDDDFVQKNLDKVLDLVEGNAQTEEDLDVLQEGSTSASYAVVEVVSTKYPEVDPTAVILSAEHHALL